MSSADSDDAGALEPELDALMAYAGVSIPPELKAGVIACYADLRRMRAVLRQPRTAAAEPSNVYSLPILLRSA